MTAPFRVYSNVAQSIADHSLLLATGSSYKQAMADRRSPDAFANDLTGVYATDPNYGASLIGLMRQYNLYRFDAGASTPQAGTAAQGTAATSVPSQAKATGGGSAQSTPAQSSPAQSSPAEGAAIPGAIAVNGAVLGVAAHQATGEVTSGRGAAGSDAAQGSSEQASVPGVLDAYAGTAAAASPASGAQVGPNTGRAVQAGPRTARVSTRRYVAQVPRIVTTGFITSAKTPLLRAEPIYRDVAASHGIRWELLAACDWMQCQAQAHVSPVYGETLGTKNPDGTIYRSKSEALDQVAVDLLELATAVYGINLRQRLILSVRELANVFAAFRWGGLLRAHRVSAMEFPYSVAGLTAAHLKMRWPAILDDAPDKPGTRFRKPFGAVPVVLGLNYPAVA